jgi:hypothetical protein
MKALIKNPKTKRMIETGILEQHPRPSGEIGSRFGFSFARYNKSLESQMLNSFIALTLLQ